MSHQLWTVAIRWNISPNQLYFLDCCRSKIKPTNIINENAEILISKNKNLLTEDNQLTPKAIAILDEFEMYLAKRKKKVTESVLGEDFLEKVKEYRELFPLKRLPSGELARQSVNELKDKFVWFFKTYPEYTWELVLDATHYYLHLKSLDEFRFTVTSSYFIKKTNITTKEQMSKLADYCQLLLDDESI